MVAFLPPLTGMNGLGAAAGVALTAGVADLVATSIDPGMAIAATALPACAAALVASLDAAGLAAPWMSSLTSASLPDSWLPP
jgi:hypothetical protein